MTTGQTTSHSELAIQIIAAVLCTYSVEFLYKAMQNSQYMAECDINIKHDVNIKVIAVLTKLAS